ncbi:MAG TPA: serine hydrolase domain-containing protein [Mobilitalea sp.]|nr:serine hydrolase domain-containing protein [Mobilitalea sp.]
MVLREGKPQEVGMSANKVKYVDEMASSWIKEEKLPALVTLVARKGVIVLNNAYGKAAYGADAAPLERDMLFPLASISKAITATAAMILVEEGKLGLHRPVSYYIPEFRGDGKDSVAVHHLLTHTSGIRGKELYEHIDSKRGKVDIPAPEPTQDLYNYEELYLSYDAPLWKQPGTEMSYSSYGYMLLGEIIRRISKKSFASFVQEKIFDPLGMKDTFFVVPESVYKRVVRRNPDGPDQWAGTPEHLADPNPAGGAYSTAMDMAIFAQMFLNKGTYGDKRILSRATVETMTKNQIPGISASWGNMFFPEGSWGYGWSIQGNKRDEYGSLCSGNTFSHGGAGGTFLWVDPDRELVGVFFSVYSHWDDCGTDLFSNMVMSAIEEDEAGINTL